MDRHQRDAAILEWIQSLGFSVPDMDYLANGVVLYELLTTLVPNGFPPVEETVTVTIELVRDCLQSFLEQEVDSTSPGSLAEEIIHVMVNCAEKNLYISKLLELSDSTQKTMMAIIQKRMSDDDRKGMRNKEPSSNLARRATMMEGTALELARTDHSLSKEGFRRTSDRMKVKELQESMVALNEERDKLVEENVQLKDELQAAIDKHKKDRRKLEQLREKTKEYEREKSKQFEDMHLELRLQIDAAHLRMAETEKNHIARVAKLEDELDLAKNQTLEAQRWKQRHDALQKKIDQMIHERRAEVSVFAVEEDESTSVEVNLSKRVDLLQARLRDAEEEGTDAGRLGAHVGRRPPSWLNG
eukprot:GEMP01060276.1.p1 GENE.GEMP01060276.1~~GEMP01060276.1.p1  ORF type:complete len:358 (+),score=93.95 GEMP01060276.1:144-1217(+)